MFFPSRQVEQERQRQRLEEQCDEEKSLRERILDSWPSDVVTGDARNAEEINGTVMRRVMQEHDKPHGNTRNESWHIKSFLGRDRRFAFTATFSLTAVSSSMNPPDESSDVSNLAVVQWTITDDNPHGPKKYYRFSCLDHRAPVMLSALLAKGDLGNVEPHLMQATVEQFNRDVLVCPDQLIEEPVRGRFSDLDLRFGKCFLKRIQPSVREVSKDILALTTYHLHLEGCTNEDPSGDLSKEHKAVLDVTLSPRLVPVVDGDHGVLGCGDWKDDYFCYGFPHMRVVQCSLRITRASDDLEVARQLDIKIGEACMEHRFGGVVPRSTAESNFLRTQRVDMRRSRESVLVDRCMIFLFNEGQDRLSISRFTPLLFSKDGKEEPSEDKEKRHLFTTVQSGKTRAAHAYWSTPDARTGYAHDIAFTSSDAGRKFRSDETSMVYPMEYHVRVPMYDGIVAELEVKMAFPDQELTSSLLQPSSWLGTVKVEGTLIKPAADGETGPTKVPVTGVGFMECSGYGAVQDARGLLNSFRSAAITPLKAAEVAALAAKPEGWVAISEGPALASLRAFDTVAAISKVALSDAHRVVLAAMFGVYGSLYHNGGDRKRVNRALMWFEGKWVGYFGVGPIDTTTLTLRAFMLRELGDVIHSKCGAWVTKEAAALDLVTAPLSASTSLMNVEDAMQDKQIPSPEALATTPTGLELSQLKALLDGTWKFDFSSGSLSAVLVEQHVPVLWRNLMGKVDPSYEYEVDRDTQHIAYTATTIIEEVDRVIRVDGKEWAWTCPARGQLRSRACVLDEGRQLYTESYGQQGVERVWLSFSNHGRTLRETICYFRTRDAQGPSAWCVRSFKNLEHKDKKPQPSH